TLHRSSLLHRSGTDQLHQPLYPPRPCDGRHHRKRLGAHAASARRGTESANLFSAGGNRNPERARKLGTLRRPHLQTQAGAPARAVLRLKRLVTKSTNATKSMRKLEPLRSLWTLCEV